MNANPQMDLFGAPEEKSYPGANGVKLPYWEQDGKIIRIALSDKLILPVTNQKGGHIYTNVPGYGRVDYRGKNAKTSFLSHAATLRRALELNESIIGRSQSNVRDAEENVRDAEEQGELVRAALAQSLELEAKNTWLLAELESARAAEAKSRKKRTRDSRKLEKENARLASLLESAFDTIAQKQKSRRWVNNLAVEWALDQELPTGLKAILVTFAAHSDEHRESWPSVEYIAKKWKMHRATVRAGIKSLNADKLLIDTGRKAGETGQVKVQRLPEIAIEGVPTGPPFIEDESGQKADKKPTESGQKGGPAGTPNKEQGIRNKNNSEKRASGTSVPSLGDKPSADALSSFFFLSLLQKKKGKNQPGLTKYAECIQAQTSPAT